MVWCGVAAKVDGTIRLVENRMMATCATSSPNHEFPSPLEAIGGGKGPVRAGRWAGGGRAGCDGEEAGVVGG